MGTGGCRQGQVEVVWDVGWTFGKYKWKKGASGHRWRQVEEGRARLWEMGQLASWWFCCQ